METLLSDGRHDVIYHRNNFSVSRIRIETMHTAFDLIGRSNLLMVWGKIFSSSEGEIWGTILAIFSKKLSGAEYELIECIHATYEYTVSNRF